MLDRPLREPRKYANDARVATATTPMMIVLVAFS